MRRTPGPRWVRVRTRSLDSSLALAAWAGTATALGEKGSGNRGDRVGEGVVVEGKARGGPAAARLASLPSINLPTLSLAFFALVFRLFSRIMGCTLGLERGIMATYVVWQAWIEPVRPRSYERIRKVGQALVGPEVGRQCGDWWGRSRGLALAMR